MASGLLVYQNGRYVPDAEAAVSVFDPGVMFGYMVFDVTRTFAGEPFRLRGKWGHLERLYASMKRVGIDCGMDINQMEAATRATIERNRGHFADGDDYMIRQYVSNGPPPGVPGLPAEPTVVIYLQPLREMLAPRAPFYAAGVAARITNQRSVPARLIDPKVKNTSRIYYRLAQAQAELVDRDAWALMTDEDGFITEGPAWSFMIVQDGVLISPEPR
ncbi:MAG TPA: aminotransferase class IV, partial [Chloroflexota bacterium]|nr:aminotransferase class IV [Chloroflexota bacterium]